MSTMDKKYVAHVNSWIFHTLMEAIRSGKKFRRSSLEGDSELESILGSVLRRLEAEDDPMFVLLKEHCPHWLSEMSQAENHSKK